MNDLIQRVQVSNATEFNRYPAIFARLQRYAREERDGKLKLLSFGCSTGEEIASLDSMYMSDCHLVGVDIDRAAIGTARLQSAQTSNKCEFFHSDEFDFSATFDVVLGLSVLCRWPDSKTMSDISSLYSMSAFERQVESLDGLLACGGLLVLHNTNYFFEDTMTFSNRYAIYEPGVSDIGFVSRFDLAGRRYTNARSGHVFFKKMR